MDKKHLNYLRRYAEAGEGGTARIWFSPAITDLCRDGCLERHERRVTIETLRITRKGRQVLADADKKIRSGDDPLPSLSV